MGGRVALRAALQRHGAIRGLVLVSTSPGIEDLGERRQRRAWDEGMAAKAITLGSDCFERHWQQLPMIETQGIMPDPYLTEMRERRASMLPTSLAQTLRGVGSGSVPDVWRDLARVTCPTLLVVGANDHTYLHQAERMSRLFPHATMNVIDGAGHAPHLEQPSRFLDALERFLRGLSGDGEK